MLSDREVQWAKATENMTPKSVDCAGTTMNRRSFLAGAAGVGGLTLAGCTGYAQPSADADYDIGMTASAFVPVEVEISAGETLVWKNTGSRAHTVTAYEARIPDAAAYFASGGFDDEIAAREGYASGFKGTIQSSDTFEHRFAVPGEYHYFCIPHERGGMKGRVIVNE